MIMKTPPTRTPGRLRRALIGMPLIAALVGGAVVSACPASAETPQADAAIWWLIYHQGSTAYDGLCETMAENAYGVSGKYATALDDYRAQADAGAIHTDTNPPRGALVFYAGDSSAGHIEISNGDGQFWDSDGTIHEVDFAYGGTYYGWSDAPADWTT